MRRVSLAAAMTLAFASAAPAQGPAPQYFVVHQEVAKPWKLADYEATTREFIAMVKANRAKMPHFSFECLTAPDFTYVYVAPIAGMAGMDTINAEFGALAQAAGPAFLDLMKRGGDTMEYAKESVVQRMPELSYMPAQPRLKPEEVNYVHYELYYAMPGREFEADALSADYVKLFKSTGIAQGYTLYKAVVGPELPLYIVAVGARDAADFHAEDAKTQAALGAEGQALGARALAITRRFEVREGRLRRDLSLPPQ